MFIILKSDISKSFRKRGPTHKVIFIFCRTFVLALNFLNHFNVFKTYLGDKTTVSLTPFAVEVGKLSKLLLYYPYIYFLQSLIMFNLT